jgi:3-hydroxy-9,10-secoandrosta-1,3,5(10)-triene-9,17-dione monooxygenase
MATDKSPTLKDLLTKADAIGALGEKYARETETARRLHPEVGHALLESGLIKMLQPVRFGGYETPFAHYAEVIKRIGCYDLSTAWVSGILSIHHYWGGLVSPELQEELWGKDPETIFTDSFMPAGKTEIAKGGLRLSGRWAWLSGTPFAQWVAVGAIGVFEEGAEPEYMMLFLPEGDYTVIDDWYTMGLRGSSSVSVEVKDALVPTHRIFRLGRCMQSNQYPGQAVNPGGLYQIPFVPALALALVAPGLGGAQGMLDRFKARAKSRIPVFSGQRQADFTLSQTALAETTVDIEMADGLLKRYAAELDEAAAGRLTLNNDDRMRLFAWRAIVSKRSRQASQAIMDFAGAGASYEHEPLQRFYRDMYMMGQHIALNYETSMRNYGKNLLGLPPDSVLY